jgi:hypothetical protein
MSTNKGFSVASVVLSYFLVAGGLLVGLLVAGIIKVNTAVVVYILIAAGAFLGGFIAARASAGSTIVEPVIGALLFVATIVGGIKATPVGAYLPVASGGVGIFAGLTAGGALIGAFLSEKIMGNSAQSSAPWFVYSAVSSLGAVVVGLILAMLLMMRGDVIDGNKVAVVFIIGAGVGCLLSGLAVGSSALERPILSNLLGTAVGVFALFFLGALAQSGGEKSNAMIGGAVIAIGGAVASTIGVALGWNLVGKNNA